MSRPARAVAALDVLAAAAQEVTRDPDAVREDAGSAEEVARLTGVIADEVRRAVLDQPGLAGALPPSTLARRLVAELRRRFLDSVTRRKTLPPTADVLAVLTGIEAVDRSVQAGWDQRFSERLSGPDGLALVVEVAHDLRSPLTSILFLAETLLRGRSGPVTALQERQLGLIYSAAFGLSSVASDVVELVRGRDHLLDLEPMPFSVTEIFESVRDIVRPMAEEKGLEVQLVPPVDPFRVGHPVAINRVLLNLVTNAIKFTDEGRVELSARDTGEEIVEFAVQDTGRGIPPQAMPLLFEPFRRRRRDQEYAFSGAGLGLSICRRFVEAMGSELEVETELGRGTRFQFSLRLPRPSHDTAPVLVPSNGV
jgi:signal transduction histidine kinase